MKNRVISNITNQTKMNYQELSKQVHANAVNHGFWEVDNSTPHCLALVVTEIAEMVEADRQGKHANKKVFDSVVKNYKTPNDEWFANVFGLYIKNSVEDEMADVVIRLLDLAGALAIDFSKIWPSSYKRDFKNFRFTENAYSLIKALTKEIVCVERRVFFCILYVEMWAKALNIDLEWHVANKMRYNATRPIKHGKKY